MKKTDIYKDLNDAKLKLLEMARESCWNKISEECEFILSEIDDNRASNFLEKRKLRNEENLIKSPTALKDCVKELTNIFSDLYDVNLYIFQSKKAKTIIEIRYFLKSKLELDYQRKVYDKDPMLHCKIGIPPYHTNKEIKYDINWELGGLRDKWNMFCWRTAFKLKKK